jgi:hypothetical protein
VNVGSAPRSLGARPSPRHDRRCRETSRGTGPRESSGHSALSGQCDVRSVQAERPARPASELSDPAISSRPCHTLRPLTCAPTATRTRDLLLRRQSLYPLSYRGVPASVALASQAYRVRTATPQLKSRRASNRDRPSGRSSPRRGTRQPKFLHDKLTIRRLPSKLDHRGRRGSCSRAAWTPFGLDDSADKSAELLSQQQRCPADAAARRGCLPQR